MNISCVTVVDFVRLTVDFILKYEELPFRRLFTRLRISDLLAFNYLFEHPCDVILSRCLPELGNKLSAGWSSHSRSSNNHRALHGFVLKIRVMELSNMCHVFVSLLLSAIPSSSSSQLQELLCLSSTFTHPFFQFHISTLQRFKIFSAS